MVVSDERHMASYVMMTGQYDAYNIADDDYNDHQLMMVMMMTARIIMTTMLYDYG